MKRMLLICLGGLMALGSARSALILDEPFNYADGALVDSSAGRWSTHGGTSNQIEVLASRVVLTQTETEDASALLEGGPFRGPVLYAGFTVSFTGLPTGDGNYFAHFKDSTATGFRCRVYATTNGAAPGKVRVGIANSAGAPAMVASDLDRDANYRLVVRYHSGTPASVLWINPVAETSTRDQAEATDSGTALSIISFGLRQAVAAGDGMGTLTLDTLKVGTSFIDVVEDFDPKLAPPALSPIASQNIPANSSTPAVPFSVLDGETAADNLLLTATSDNPGLVGVSGVVFGGGGSNRTVRVTPTPGRQGAARITVTVTDADGNTANGTFLVTVGVPTLSPIPDQVTPIGVATAPIAFGIGDAEGDRLLLGVISGNDPLVPVAEISFGGSGSARTITLRPAPGRSGLARISVFVSDGFNTVSNSFLLTVFPTRGVLLRDDFSYPDGSLITNSLFAWTTHSAALGQTGQTQVANGRLLLTSAQGEDFHANLGEAPYAPAEFWVLYARFTVAFHARPASGGDYFAHFRGASSGASGRLFALSSGAAPGRFRLALANNDTSPSVILPRELDTNTTYSVVVRYNAATGQSVLWVNPSSEEEPGLAATDDPGPIEIWSYAFRQSAGIGALAVDELRIGTSFADVTGYRLKIRRLAQEVEVSWPQVAQAAGYRLETSHNGVATGWEEVKEIAQPMGADLVLRYPSGNGQQFFRLVR